MLDLIGKKIVEARYCSFYLEKKLSCELLVLFVRTENEQWYGLTLGDGFSSVFKTTEDPAIISLEEIEDDFAYPVQPLPEHHRLIGRKIIGIQDYLWQGQHDQCGALLLLLDDGRKLTLLENKDENIELIEGIASSLSEKFQLKSKVFNKPEE